MREKIVVYVVENLKIVSLIFFFYLRVEFFSWKVKWLKINIIF